MSNKRKKQESSLPNNSLWVKPSRPAKHRKKYDAAYMEILLDLFRTLNPDYGELVRQLTDTSVSLSDTSVSSSDTRALLLEYLEHLNQGEKFMIWQRQRFALDSLKMFSEGNRVKACRRMNATQATQASLYEAIQANMRFYLEPLWTKVHQKLTMRMLQICRPMATEWHYVGRMNRLFVPSEARIEQVILNPDQKGTIEERCIYVGQNSTTLAPVYQSVAVNSRGAVTYRVKFETAGWRVMVFHTEPLLSYMPTPIKKLDDAHRALIGSLHTALPDDVYRLVIIYCDVQY